MADQEDRQSRIRAPGMRALELPVVDRAAAVLMIEHAHPHGAMTEATHDRLFADC